MPRVKAAVEQVAGGVSEQRCADLAGDRALTLVVAARVHDDGERREEQLQQLHGVGVLQQRPQKRLPAHTHTQCTRPRLQTLSIQLHGSHLDAQYGQTRHLSTPPRQYWSSASAVNRTIVTDPTIPDRVGFSWCRVVHGSILCDPIQPNPLAY